MNPRTRSNNTPLTGASGRDAARAAEAFPHALADASCEEQEQLALRSAHLRHLVTELAAPREPGIDALCRVAVNVCEVDCSAVLVGRGETRGALHTTDDMASSMEDLQVTVGEGPCVDAWETRGPVFTPDLDEPELLDRWPGFAPLARSAGVRAVFAFPLQVGAVRLGTFSLYRRQPGGLGQDEARDALLLTAVAVDRLLALSEDTDAHEGRALGLGEDSLKIYQATGMVAAQLGRGVEEAFARLRGVAFSEGLPLSTVAAQVLDGTVELTPPRGPEGSCPAVGDELGER